MNCHIVFISLIVLICSCTNSGNTELVIDPEIKDEVNENTSQPINLGEESPLNNLLIYNNNIYLESYENGKLIGSTFEEPNQMFFKSWYFFRNDTLLIEGAFGLFGGIGFFAKIFDNTATIYHMVASDDFPTYAYDHDGPIIDRLEVSCIEARMTLSFLPTIADTSETIYGMTEFTSEEYYQGVQVDNLKRVSAKMKIYFKADYFEL